jgi:hypothetical protein
MSRALRELAEARAARDAARAALDARLLRLRGDPAQVTTGQHLMTRATAEARSALDEVLEIAMQSKTVIGATIALLALWFLREPILEWIAALGDDHAGEGDETATDEAETDD